jgi:hypothetical protein
VPESAYNREYLIVLRRQTPTGWAEWCRYRANEIDYALSILSPTSQRRYCISKRDDA